MHYKTTAYSKFVLLVHELRLPCRILQWKTTAYSEHSLRQSRRDDFDVHSFVNQLINDHYSAVFVLYFRDTGTVDVTTHHESESSAGRYKMIMRVNRLSPTLASCVVSVGRCSDEHRISGGYD